MTRIQILQLLRSAKPIIRNRFEDRVFGGSATQEFSKKAAIKPSLRSRTIEYAIRDLIANARKLERDVIYLNIGDPVKYGFDTPRHVKEELVKAVESGFNYYSDSEGLSELREAIAERERGKNGISLGKEDVIITDGVSEGISMLMGSLIEQGDQVLIPGPSYPPYISYLKFFGGTPVEYRTVEENGWNPDVSDIRKKITEKTRAIEVINPNNPTGAMYNSRALRDIADIALENNLLVISDEIYDEITYEGSFQSISSLNKEVPVVGLNGFSKSSLMTGWRLGYLYFRGSNNSLDELKDAVAKQTRIRLCANSPVQKAAVAAIKGSKNHVANLVSELKKRRDYSYKRINEIKGLKATKPPGAFYLFPKIDNSLKSWASDTEFVLDLLSKTAVLLVPGSGFGKEYGSWHFRMVFLPPIETLEVALDRIESFMSNL